MWASVRTAKDGGGCFFFNDTATTEIYTLSLHDALPISHRARAEDGDAAHLWGRVRRRGLILLRSEEHTSELQSRQYLVCRLLLEKKKILPSIAYCLLLMDLLRLLL